MYAMICIDRIENWYWTSTCSIAGRVAWWSLFIKVLLNGNEVGDQPEIVVATPFLSLSVRRVEVRGQNEDINICMPGQPSSFFSRLLYLYSQSTLYFNLKPCTPSSLLAGLTALDSSTARPKPQPQQSSPSTSFAPPQPP